MRRTRLDNIDADAVIASSTASAFVSISRPAFEAWYAALG
jgi:hypothetical protein